MGQIFGCWACDEWVFFCTRIHSGEFVERVLRWQWKAHQFPESNCMNRSRESCIIPVFLLIFPFSNYVMNLLNLYQ